MVDLRITRRASGHGTPVGGRDQRAGEPATWDAGSRTLAPSRGSWHPGCPCAPGTSGGRCSPRGRTDEPRGARPRICSAAYGPGRASRWSDVAQEAGPQRLLLFLAAAGFASSWVVGLVVVGVLHGADVAVGGSTLRRCSTSRRGGPGVRRRAATGLGSPTRLRGSRPSAAAASSRFARRLHNPARVAAAAGSARIYPAHLLVALNAIASERPALSSALQVAIFVASGSWSPRVARPGGGAPRARSSPSSTPRRRRSVVTST